MRPTSGQSEGDEGAVDESSLSPPCPQRLRLLVVDDEPVVAKFVERVLAADCEVTMVDCGAAAISLLAQPAVRIDLILCDLMMPGTSGADVYLAVRRVRPTLASRFLVMTGGAFTRQTSDFLAQVRPPVLVKPFDIRKLRTALFGLLTPGL